MTSKGFRTLHITIVVLFAAMIAQAQVGVASDTSSLSTEEFLIRLARTLERPTKVPTKNRDVIPAQDVSPCVAEVLHQPELASLVKNYRSSLEHPIGPTLKLDAKEQDLANPKLLVDLLAHATAQHKTLKETRVQLSALREAYSNAIREINSLKQGCRKHLVKLEKATLDKE